MKKTTLLLLLAGLYASAASAQTPAAANQKMALTGQTVGQFAQGLLRMDQARLGLTPAQAHQAQAVLIDYATKYNALSQGPVPSIEKIKTGLPLLDAERIHRYKAFLTAEQYTKLVTSYNKSHPKTPVK